MGEVYLTNRRVKKARNSILDTTQVYNFPRQLDIRFNKTKRYMSTDNFRQRAKNVKKKKNLFVKTTT